MAFERRQYSGTASTSATLAGSISGAATSFSISDETGWPDGSVGPFFATIDRNKPGEEHVKCLSRLGAVVTVAPGGRGADGTSAVAHSAGVKVEHTISKTDLDEANEHYANPTLDHHTNYLTVGRHDITARHQAGAGIPTAAPTNSNPGDAASEGASTALARASHTHGREAHTLAQHGVGVGWAAGVAPTTAALGDVAAEGASGSAARANHLHGMPTVAAVRDAVLPAGVIAPYAAAAAPAGWLICDGASYLRTDFPALFAAIGVTFGSVDGTHFNVPNLKGRIPVGLDGGQAEFDGLGETGGEKTHVLTAAEMPAHGHTQDPHSHGVTDPQHHHAQAPETAATTASTIGLVATGTNQAAFTSAFSTANAPTGVTVNNATATNQNTGAGSAHNNLQPYMALTYIIKAA